MCNTSRKTWERKENLFLKLNYSANENQTNTSHVKFTWGGGGGGVKNDPQPLSKWVQAGAKKILAANTIHSCISKEQHISFRLKEL